MSTQKKSEDTQANLDELIVSENVALTPEVSEQIKKKVASLKAEKGIKKIFVIIVEGDQECGEKPLYIAYMRRPNLSEFSKYMTFVQKDLAQANIMLANDIFVDGDRELVTDEDLFIFGTMTQLSRVIDSRNGDLVKK